MEKELSDKIDLLLHKLDTLTDILTSFATAKISCRYTLFEWLDIWFKAYKAPTLRDGGYDLRNTLEKHIKPYIINKPLSDYTSLDITEAINKVQSSRMRQVVYQAFNQAFREAVRAEYITQNPVDKVDRPKHTYSGGRALTLTEEAELLEIAASDKLYSLIRFYLLTGARPSEPLVIRWEDITVDTVRIRGTKTEKADRVLPIGAPLKELLSSLPRGSPGPFPYTYAYVRKYFERLRRKLSFTFTLKDLRHTFGTRCLENGVSMKTVQKWLGHSNYSTTANIYSHVTTVFERSEIAKLDK